MDNDFLDRIKALTGQSPDPSQAPTGGLDDSSTLLPKLNEVRSQSLPSDLSAAGVPMAQPSSPGAVPKSPMDYMVTPDDLKQAQDQKSDDLRLGMIMNGLGNRQGFGNFFLGHMNPHNDYSQYTKQLMDQADQPIKNKELLQKQAIQAPEMQYIQNMQDPDHPLSQATKGLVAGVISKNDSLDPENKQAFMDAVSKGSGYDALKIAENPAFKDSVGQNVALQKMLATMNMAGQRLDVAKQNLGVKQDNQTNAAVTSFDSNPLIQETSRQLGQIQRDRHTLQSADIITPQMLHEISNGIANALSGGKGVGLGMADMQDLSTSSTKWAQLEQMITNKPQNGASAAVKQQVMDTLDRLEGAYQKYQGNLANKLKQGRGFQHNAAANTALDSAAQKYQPPAQAPQGGGPKVGEIQDGHTFKGGDPAKQENWEEVK